MSGREQAQELVDAMGGVEAGPALDALAARRLAALPAEEVAAVLADLVSRTPEEARERKVIAAVCHALLWGGPDLPAERRRAIRVAAISGGLAVVIGLLTEATPARNGRDEPTARRADPEVGALTLGHRKQAARRETSPHRLARLAADTDPTVIANLLLNPRMTEALVVRIAARRPTSAEALSEVARSVRWSARRDVRRAIALNPYADPTVVCALLPMLMGGDLRDVAASGVLHPAVCDAARALLRARGEHEGDGAAPSELAHVLLQ